MSLRVSNDGDSDGGGDDGDSDDEDEEEEEKREVYVKHCYESDVTNIIIIVTVTHMGKIYILFLCAAMYIINYNLSCPALTTFGHQ